MNNVVVKYRYFIIFGLALVSFLIVYSSVLSFDNAKYEARVESDTLSGQKYNTAGIYNYKENNPYGSYFVGFDELIDRGVSNDEWLYISDVLTNFTMYNKKIYNGKISYVKDSFTREDKGGSNFNTYAYEFGINDSNIYIMRVQSSWAQEIIRISITDENNEEVFFKEFKIYEG